MEKILHLVLKSEWYDMIEGGVKTEEYREIKPYWTKRFRNFDFTHVTFHKGYTNETMTFEIRGFEIGKGNEEWGAPDKDVYIIKLK